MVRLSYIEAAKDLGLQDEVVEGVIITADYVLRRIVNDYNANLESQGIELTNVNKMTLKRAHDYLMDDSSFLKEKEFYETSDTKRMADPVTDIIEKIFGPNTPIGDVEKPKAYTPREIEYTHPESLTVVEKDKLSEGRVTQGDKGNLATTAMYDFIGTGESSEAISDMGINTDAIQDPIKKVVPLEIMYGFMDKIDNSSDQAEVNAIITKFTEANIKHNQIVPEKYGHMMNVVIAMKSRE